MTDHDSQRALWEQEHEHPHMLLPMDSHDPSSGIPPFWEWLEGKNAPRSTGIEMGCGKGRNGIWLAKQGCEMESFDFSTVAIAEAERRAAAEGVNPGKVHFRVHDAVQAWPFTDASFDFGIDCFSSSDIESLSGRSFAREEFWRVLKSGAFLFVYALGFASEFQRMMVKQSPGQEKGSFFHPSGKFEITYSESNLLDFYKDFSLCEKRVTRGETEFYGKLYKTENYWCVFQKT